MTQFTVTAAALRDAAQWASTATPSRPIAPVLAGLLLDVRDGRVAVTGYDYNTRATATIGADVTGPGRLLVSGKLLVAMAKTIPPRAEVTFTDTGGTVEAVAGRARWSLPLLPVDDYPGLPDLGAPVGHVKAGDLRAALARVLPAASRDVTLPSLAGVKVECEGDRMTLAATDRYRISAAEISWTPADGGEPWEAVVPTSLMTAASRAGGSDDELLAVSCSVSGFGLAGGAALLAGRLIDEVFPAWRRIMPEPGDRFVVLEREPLLQAVEQALVAAENDGVLLAIDVDGIRVAAAGEGRQAVSWAPARLVGEPLAVKLNAGYLRDALTSHDTSEVTVHLYAQHRPLLVVSDTPGYRHLVMPARMSDAERAAIERPVEVAA